MNNVIIILQIAVSLFLTGAILLQAQGGGLGVGFAGGQQYHTRRGVEKVLFTATIVGLILFMILTLATILVSA